MKISGFTIVRNTIKYNYPVLESINSILPLCDEFVINVGDSEDETLKLIQGLIKAIKRPKFKILQSTWDLSSGSTVLAQQTNLTLKECTGDWAFYLQADEVIHEEDLSRLKRCMQKYLNDEDVDALRFRWLHFYGSYYRYRIDSGWYQKQDRIIRNNGQIESCGDAYAFRRKDRRPLRCRPTGAFVYHYGWVHSEDVMTQRRVNAEQIGFTSLNSHERGDDYSYGDLNRFPAYFGTHPKVMKERVAGHSVSQNDWQNISRRFWWHPGRIFRLRYKTGRRLKEKIA